MEPTYYTVMKISGEYAILISDSGGENTVAMALLPPETDEGIRMLFENFSYTVV